jgi:hypothetical protein
MPSNVKRVNSSGWGVMKEKFIIGTSVYQKWTHQLNIFFLKSGQSAMLSEKKI